MNSTFPASYECVLDPEFLGSGAFPNLHRYRDRSQRPHIAHLRHESGVEWYAELGKGELVTNGLTEAYTTPSSDHVLVVLNGSGYYVNARDPGRVSAVQIEPIKQVEALPEHDLLLLLSPCEVAAYAASGHLWTSERIALDGVRLIRPEGDQILVEVDMGDEEPHRVLLALRTGAIDHLDGP